MFQQFDSIVASCGGTNTHKLRRKRHKCDAWKGRWQGYSEEMSEGSFHMVSTKDGKS